MRLLYFSIFILFILTACKEKCDETIPLHIIEIGEELIPYEVNDTISFVNSTNDTTSYYYSIVEESFSDSDIGLSCPVNTESRFSIFTRISPSKLNEIYGFNFLVDITNLNVNNSADTLLANRIYISSLDVEEGLQGFQNSTHHKLKLYYPRSNFDVPSGFEQNISFHAEITIGNTLFKEVYKSGESPSCFFYNVDKGIVGFEDGNNILWVLSN